MSLAFTAAAQEIGTVTLLEGGLRVIRGATVLKGAEGVRLHRGDIVETFNPGFAQAELPGGAVVAFGPSTRAFFFKRAANITQLIVLAGWLKTEVGPNAGTYYCASPLLAATTRDGNIVLQASSEATNIFVESGSAGISDVSPAGYLGHPRAAKAGQFFSRRAGQGITMTPRPQASFIEAVPRPFRDTLPSRLARFSGKPTTPQRDHAVTYAEIQPWLTIGQAWRQGFVQRFEPRLKDIEFRKALEAHLRDYPEWDPILHPENYEPKTPPESDTPEREQRR